MTVAVTTNHITKVQKRRHDQGWTQAEVAHRARISVRTLWGAENRRPVRPTSVRKILKGLRIPPEEWQDWFVMAPKGAKWSSTRRIAR